MTPTPEQMQEFKDWYCKYNEVMRASFSEEDWNCMYELYTAYHQHCMMSDPGFQSNAELKRKLAALKDELDGIKEQRKNDMLLAASAVKQIKELEQQLTASHERVKELEDELSTAKERIDYLLSL